MKSKKTWLTIAVIFVALVIFKITTSPLLRQMAVIRKVVYDQNLTLALGGGGNSAILAGDNAVLVIDTKMSLPSSQFYSMAKKIAGDKPIIVVNTHIHPDHIKGNALYKGSQIYAGGNYSKDFWIKEANAESLPTDWVKDRIELKIGDETVILKNMPYSIHTKSDLVVYLKNRKMLFTGDTVLNRQAPALMKKTGVDIDGYFKAFEEYPKMFDIEKVVPGHGDIGGIDLIADFKQYLLDMKNAANDPAVEKEMIKKYKDWKQVPMFMSNETVIKFLRGETK